MLDNKNYYLALLLTLCFSCQNQKATGTKEQQNITERRWKLVSSYPNSLTTFKEITDYFKENVSDLTGGMFKIKAYQPGEIVPALGVFDAVSGGSVEMGITAGYFYSGKNSALILDTGEPFGMTARAKNAWLYEHGGLELLQELYKKYNIMYFPIGNTGCQMGGWFKKEINSLEDLKGLRLRVPGVGGEVYSKLGVSIQVLGAGDIFPALEQGALDGTEFVGPYDDQQLGFQSITKYYYSPGWQETGSTICFYMNLDKWNSLSKQEQAIIANVCRVCNQSMLNKYDAYNSKALQELKDKGVILKRFSNEILAATRQKTEEILKKYSEENPDFKKIYKSIRDFQKKSSDWFSANEYQLLNFENTIDE